MFEARFQSFEDESESASTAPRVAALRAELARRALDGFIVPHADRYQNEYVPPPETWIEQNLPAGTKLGYDPWLHTVEGAERLAKACAAADAALVPTEPNPIDAVWSDRPPPPLGPVTLHDLRYAGEDAAAKLARIRGELAKLKADALVVSNPQGVAWTFNIRGADVTHTPLPLG